MRKLAHETTQILYAQSSKRFTRRREDAKFGRGGKLSLFSRRGFAPSREVFKGAEGRPRFDLRNAASTQVLPFASSRNDDARREIPAGLRDRLYCFFFAFFFVPG